MVVMVAVVVVGGCVGEDWREGSAVGFNSFLAMSGADAGSTAVFSSPFNADVGSGDGGRASRLSALCTCFSDLSSDSDSASESDSEPLSEADDDWDIFRRLE